MSESQQPAPQPHTPPPPQGQSKAFEAFKAFWSTFPGILTAIGGLIAALATLISSLDKAALLRHPTPTPPPTAIVSQAASPSPALSPSPLPTATEAPSLTPVPTLAPSPTALPSPTAAQPAEGALWVDDFSDSSTWETGGDSDYEISYQDDEYRVVVHSVDTFVWGNPKRSYDLSDLLIEVDARRVAGPANNQIGLIVRRQDDENFYLFAISSDGTYGVDKFQNGDWSSLAEWKFSKSVKRGTEWNHLRVECVGARMRFYVNGDLLAEVEDKAFASGNIGLGAGTVDEGGVEARFDNLRLQVLKRL